MGDFSVRDAKIAVAVITTLGTLAIIWGGGFADHRAFLNLMDFASSETIGEFVFGFVMVHLPMALAVLAAGLVFTDLRLASWLLFIGTILWLLFTLLWWVADGSSPPTTGIFGTIFQAAGAYLAFKAHGLDQQSSSRPQIGDSGQDGGDA